jgi:hypothetical protein
VTLPDLIAYAGFPPGPERCIACGALGAVWQHDRTTGDSEWLCSDADACAVRFAALRAADAERERDPCDGADLPRAPVAAGGADCG